MKWEKKEGHVQGDTQKTNTQLKIVQKFAKCKYMEYNSEKPKLVAVV